MKKQSTGAMSLPPCLQTISFPRTIICSFKICRHVVEARRIAQIIKLYRKRKADFNYKDYGELQRVQAAQSLIIAQLSRSMRLTQQATRDKNMRLPGRRIIDKLEEW